MKIISIYKNIRKGGKREGKDNKEGIDNTSREIMKVLGGISSELRSCVKKYTGQETDELINGVPRKKSNEIRSKYRMINFISHAPKVEGKVLTKT